MKIFDSTMGLIQKSMDLRFRRHAVLSSNVANAETPGFVARELDFNGELQRAAALKNSEPQQKMDQVHHTDSSKIVHDYSTRMGADGNNVDLDIVTNKMSANARAYSNAATLMSMKFRLLREAARGQGGV